ncbi:endoplasmic reticulum metallopeptidase 1 isoform X2 [Cephus cinctus]|uniref:FXNA-like protease n=1 Tax=Cephus cinctus TaxID=211228 RepID=A0AAJ7FCH0_CEPCN|nr:endoplasmic reticulum metallopeptidase 1 isoform X2 [Cephus cinctus]
MEGSTRGSNRQFENDANRQDIRYRLTRDSHPYNSVSTEEEKEEETFLIRQKLWYIRLAEHFKKMSSERCRNTIPTYWGTLFAVFVVVGILVVNYNTRWNLPTALTVESLRTAEEGDDLFIAERARADNIGLTKIGDRVVGSYENEVLAVEYLQNLLLQIQDQAINNKSVQISIETSSGGYYLSGTRGLTNMYANVTNVVARLSDVKMKDYALLVNCHFDSHLLAPGAADNGLNCAVMLEVLRVLSRSRTTLKYDVVFLFNGAEENPLQGSHAFITTSKWANIVKVVLNYDAAGNGGRESLFQDGPGNSWLTAYYASVVPHPSGSSILTDVYESGLIPSNTDFAIFRKFGNIPGLDMAHSLGGYIYHTSLDDYHRIPNGTYQNTGDNMMALVKALANAEELETATAASTGTVVFYDFYAILFIRYTWTVGIIINILVVLIALCGPLLFIYTSPYLKNTLVMFTINFISQLIGIILGIGLAILICLITDWANKPMSWFTRQWLLIGLVWTPTMIPMLIVNAILGRTPLTKSRFGRIQGIVLQCEAVTVLWCIVLLIGLIAGLKSSYVLTMVCGFSSSALLISAILRLERHTICWLSVYVVIGLLIPILYGFWTVNFMSSIISIMGRAGSQIVPDLYVSALYGLISVIFCSFWAPLICLLERPWTLITGFILATLIILFGVLFTTLGFPYSGEPTDPSPERFWLIHTQRTFHDISGNVIATDAGYWILNLDRNSPKLIQEAVPELQNAKVVDVSCNNNITYCGMPLWKTRDIPLVNKSVWVSSKAPTINQTEESILTAAWNSTTDEARRLYLNVSGSNRLNLILVPRAGVVLNSWSLLDNVTTTITWNDRPLYFILLSSASDPAGPWQLWLDMTVSTDVDAVIDILFVSHYFLYSRLADLPYKSILNQLPPWVVPLHWTSTTKSYIF